MISRRIQAADPKDLKALQGGRGSLLKNLVGLALPIALFMGLGLFALTRSWWVSGGLSLTFLLASAYSNIAFFRGVQRVQSAPESAVECIEVEAAHVYDLEPQGSNGPAIALLTEAGECLLLVGQWLLEQKRFPARHVRVYRWTADGEPIRIESVGPKVKPVQSNAGLKLRHRPQAIQVFSARIESLEDDLDAALTP